jgi:hypothetical protein
MATTTKQILQYEPTFNPDNGLYEDISPFVKGEGGGQDYICSCRHSNKSFHSYSGWKTHTKNDFHEEYVKKYIKIAEEEKNGLRHKVQELEKEISLLKNLLEKATLRIERSKINRTNRFQRNEQSKQSEQKNEID